MSKLSGLCIDCAFKNVDVNELPCRKCLEVYEDCGCEFVDGRVFTTGEGLEDVT